MEKSSISKLANSTFTSHFFEEEKEENSCIVPIKNSNYPLKQIESTCYTPLLLPHSSKEKGKKQNR